MEVQELRPGLWRWTAPHPDWTPEEGGPGGWEQLVGCVYYEAPDAVVLIDPQAPPAGTPDADKFWTRLDEDVSRLGRPVAVLLCNDWHDRSAQVVYDRYRHQPGASVWVCEGARSRVDCTVTHTFAEGDALPGGIQAYGVGKDGDEALLYLPSHRALVAGDVLAGYPPGELRIAWSEESVRPALRRLLDLPIQMVLPSHGQPTLQDTHRALATALNAPIWGREPAGGA
ncbi:MAG: hypothetical protein ACRDJN_08090 [Chloroflexota bacterium]